MFKISSEQIITYVFQETETFRGNNFDKFSQPFNRACDTIF